MVRACLSNTIDLEGGAWADYHGRMIWRFFSSLAVNVLLWVFLLPACVGLYALAIQTSWFSPEGGELTFGHLAAAPLIGWGVMMMYYVLPFLLMVVPSTLLGWLGRLRPGKRFAWVCLMITPVGAAVTLALLGMGERIDILVPALTLVVVSALTYWLWFDWNAQDEPADAAPPQ